MSFTCDTLKLILPKPCSEEIVLLAVHSNPSDDTAFITLSPIIVTDKLLLCDKVCFE